MTTTSTCDIFISRQLGPDSLFLTQMQSKGLSVHGESLVSFQAQSFQYVPPVDWIFFYSPRAVRFFLEGLDAARLPLPAAEIAAVGPGTARACQLHGLTVDFSGSGEPEQVASAFLPLARGQRVLFPTASQSRHSVSRALGKAIIPIQLTVYRNEIRTDLQLPTARCLVFTSPLNARAYYQQYPVLPTQPVIAIGASTAAALMELSVTELHTAAAPTEAALVEEVLARL